MLSLGGSHRVFLCVKRVDFRKAHDGLCALVRDQFGDDQAIIGGLARFRGAPVVLMGHEKGHDTQSRIKHNFGMGKPEGYRKAIRLMELASRFGLPVVTLVDTSGAFPGVEAEERGARLSDRQGE